MTHYCKVGFQCGSSTPAGLILYMRQLDKAGIPFVICAAGNAELAVSAAELAEASAVPHVILLQVMASDDSTRMRAESSMPADRAAFQLWKKLEAYLASVPALEEHKGRIWIEPVLPVDSCEVGEFLGWYCTHLGRMANERGYNMALPGLIAGQPQPEDWRLPGYQAFLRACSDRPEQMAVSFHEGKLGDMAAHPEHSYPFHVGRFTWMYDACDELGIPRPTTIVSKWAWAEADMPAMKDAMRDALWLAELAAKFPSLLGICLSQLGGTEQGASLAGKLQEMIAPLTEYALQARLTGPAPRSKPVILRQRSPAQPMTHAFRRRALVMDPGAQVAEQVQRIHFDTSRGKPRAQYKRVYVLLPPQSSKKWVHAVAEATWEMFGYTIGQNPDDAGTGDLDSNTVLAVNPHLWGPGEDGRGLEGFFAKYYPNVDYQAVEARTPNQLRALLPG